MEKTFDFGKIDYYGKGRKINRVTVKVCLEEKGVKDVFTASGMILNSKETDCICGGQCLDEIAKYVKDPVFLEIYDLWKKYHLNDMHAGTPKQEAALAAHFPKGKYIDYMDKVKYLESIGLYEDDGYRYGSSWLYERIPDDALNRIKKLI